MDAADLDYRARTRSGCIPPDLVSRLLARGHVDVVEQQAGRGEWFCALAWARALGEQRRQADALEVLAPYLVNGWWTAVAATAELLEDWGRAGDAVETVRSRMEAGHPMALEFYTRLLARHGRAEEAYTLLVPHVDDWVLASALVDVAAIAGRDDDAATLLAARIRVDHRCDGPWCCGDLDPDSAICLLATICERQGRIEEAIALLRRRQGTSVNDRDQLADLLARLGRVEDLRAYAATDGGEHAVQRLAELLEQDGDLEGAVAVYGLATGPSARNPKSAYGLAQLLARHGRGDAAIDIMRAQADARPGEDWIHLRTTNPIESTFATVRLRAKVTKGASSRAAGLAMVFKLVESAQALGGPSTAPTSSRSSAPEPASNAACWSNAMSHRPPHSHQRLFR